MKNSGVVGIIILAIICYAIIAIGAIVAIIGGVIALFFLIKWLVTSIRNNLSRTKNKKLFYDMLCTKYKIPQLPQEVNINKRLLALVDELLKKHQCSSMMLEEFEKLKDSIKTAIEKSSVWINDNDLSDYSYKSSSLKRSSLKYRNIGFYTSKTNASCSCFSIGTKKTKLYFYPCFVISEINCEYNFYYYNDFDCNNKDSISVEESSHVRVKGATPAYYNYLYQRKDGGPDRRYKNNPSTPVYFYDIFKLVMAKEIQLICATHESMANFFDKIIKYQQFIQKMPIQLSVCIEDIDLSNNEYASCIKDIIAQHGKEFLLNKSFVNYLKDYRIPKEYPYFLPIFDLLYKTKSLERIIQDDCKYDELDLIKNNIIQSSCYSETEVAAVLAFISKAIQTID